MPNATVRANARTLPEETTDAHSIAAFDALYSNWWEAQTSTGDPTFDSDSDETTDRLCAVLYAAEAALAAAPTPTKRQLKHKFHYLEFSIEAGNDGDIKAAVASIKEDLKRWGFDLPDLSRGAPTVARDEAYLTTKEIIRRFGRLEEPLLDAVAWAGIVDKLVEHDLAYWPRLSQHEMNSVVQQFNFANDGLKEAIAALGDAYHAREAEAADRVLARVKEREDA
jgi:hypothetical protein